MNGTITDVAGISAGHADDQVGLTGCTVVLVDDPDGAVAAVDVRGGAPGTRETDLLAPSCLVDRVHAVVLAGGSAFGLDAASGVVRWLEEHGRGRDVGDGLRVPIVPAAVLFDLRVGSAWARPDAAMGYRACQAASHEPLAEGRRGAGTGATVGKWLRPEDMASSGIGSASVSRPNGLIVAAVVAANAYGSVIDPATGRVIAGPDPDAGHPLVPGFSDSGPDPPTPFPEREGGRGISPFLLREGGWGVKWVRWQHHHRRRRDQCRSHQGVRPARRRHGPRRAGPRHPPVPHPVRRRRPVRHRHRSRRGRPGRDRGPRRRLRRRRHRPRRHAYYVTLARAGKRPALPLLALLRRTRER